jgi:hypothetical protein
MGSMMPTPVRRRLSSAARRLQPVQVAALRSAGLAFITSRAYVVAVGAVAGLAFGLHDGDPAAVLEPYGRLGDLLTATATRFDSGFYMSIATLGYEDDPLRAAFPPLYPLTMWALAPLTRPLVATDAGAALLAGLIVSCTAFVVGLYLLHRLVALDFGEQVARRTVLALAFFPTSFFFSAVYAESLFLALSVGAVYAGRRGRWALAGVLGALASTTRLQGLLLVIPLGLMVLYGPRADGRESPRRGWRPRYPTEALKRGAWVLLVPVGLSAFVVYTWIALDDPMATLHAQEQGWNRHAALPVVSIVLGLEDAAWALDRVAAGFSPLTDLGARAALTDAAFLLFAAVAVAGAIRRLPIAYWSYALSGLLLVLLSIPDGGREHLLSLPRFVVVLFPLFIWLAIWADTPRRWNSTMAASILLLGFYSGVAATGRWVA